MEIQEKNTLSYGYEEIQITKNKWGIKKKRVFTVYHEKKEILPQAYGMRMSYPLFFEYNHILYAFIAINHINLRSVPNDMVGYDDYIEFYFCKWNDQSWNIVNSYRIDATRKIDRYFRHGSARN